MDQSALVSQVALNYQQIRLNSAEDRGSPRGSGARQWLRERSYLIDALVDLIHHKFLMGRLPSEQSL